jgi:RND family efflux transporter MFP subunit
MRDIQAAMRQLFPSIFVAGALLTTACGKGGADAAPRSRPPPLVVVSKATVRDVNVEVHAPIELRPLAQSDVGSKTLGYLDAVLVDRGDRVKHGQLIALVRPSDLPDQLSAARSALVQVQASKNLAQTNYDRASKLAPSGVVSQQELQNASSALATADAAEATAKAQVGALATRLGETRIESPLDGYVAVRRLDPGALVGLPSGGAIVTIVKTDVLRVFVTVTEKELAGVSVGKDAHVELDALPGKSVTGKVVRMAPMVDPGTRTLDAEVQIPNPSEELRPGMFGRGSIIVDTHPHAVTIPALAVQVTDNKKFVFVLEGDKARRREVKIGVDEGTWLEITAGLKEGEDVITAGIDGLGDGSPVRVVRDVDPYTGARTQADKPPAMPDSPSVKPSSSRD